MNNSEVQDVVVNNMKDDAAKELLNVRHDHNVYINLLKDLIVQCSSTWLSVSDAVV
ncbi:hypothetical protein TanjilG_04125 [Lupinus angustifolius]|uniref:Uncharacterized protein n=1 Tax=Lupinus angustifolius TaxID=3871 RepID=A0A4P1RJY7_LUPAN|nr:hypothetical protein TanjilG_04125 [Lupinus angustifolius]